MKRTFLQVAIPVLYVYDEDVVPPEAPGFDMGLLPVVSRVLKDHAGTDKVTVITGAPAPAQAVSSAYTHLALQYGSLEKASPDAGNLIVAEFVADNFDPERVLEHLQRIVDERQRELAEQVEAVTRRKAHMDIPDLKEDVESPGAGEPAADDASGEPEVPDTEGAEASEVPEDSEDEPADDDEDDEDEPAKGA